MCLCSLECSQCLWKPWHRSCAGSRSCDPAQRSRPGRRSSHSPSELMLLRKNPFFIKSQAGERLGDCSRVCKVPKPAPGCLPKHSLTPGGSGRNRKTPPALLLSQGQGEAEHSTMPRLQKNEAANHRLQQSLRPREAQLLSLTLFLGFALTAAIVQAAGSYCSRHLCTAILLFFNLL